MPLGDHGENILNHFHDFTPRKLRAYSALCVPGQCLARAGPILLAMIEYTP